MTVADHYDALAIYRPCHTEADEGAAHRSAISTWVQPFTKADARIADIGCGRGISLQLFKEAGAESVDGYCMGEDADVAIAAGLNVTRADQSEIPAADGTYDFLYCRQILEHSPAPLITLREWWRIMKPAALMFIQVPLCPEGWVTRDHLSIMPRNCWAWTFQRAGFGLVLRGFEANEYAWLVRK